MIDTDQTISSNLQSVARRRQKIRARYYEFFSHKIYDKCIIIARQLFQLEKEHIVVTNEVFNEFQYGITVCLLCKTYLLIERLKQAKVEMDAYIRQKWHFLEGMRNVVAIKNQPKLPEKVSIFITKKLSLIASIANIYYQLKENCVPYYTIYAKHIEKVFGADSIQLSNVLFCIGGYYKETNQNMKAIGCYIQAARLRAKKGGDCFVNISLLYRKMGKINLALNMMSEAIKLNEQQYGVTSSEVAEVYSKKGLLYLDILDFNNAIDCMENALKVYLNRKQSEEYKKVKEYIKMIYEKLQKHLENEERLKEETLNNLEKNTTQKKLVLKSLEDKLNENGTKGFELEKYFKISEGLLSKLTNTQILRLSELQMELEQSRSQFAVAYYVGNSKFLRKLPGNRLRELRSQNLKLFQNINIQQNPAGKKADEEDI